MKVTEALRIIQAAPSDAPVFRVALACGFTPLHVSTLLQAHLQSAIPGRRVQIMPGLYGNLAGTVESLLTGSDAHGAAVVVEWFDLDPRLGYRQTGGWSPADLPDIALTVEHTLTRIEAALLRAPYSMRIAVMLPTLGLPPVFYTPAAQASEAEFRLRQAVAQFGRCIATAPNIAVAGAQELDEISPFASRFDLKSELLTGLPYTLQHADAVSEALAKLVFPPAPKKGIITDLDDTFWKGIVGEVGVDGVSWDLASHSLLHGLYQQTLRALADGGALVGIASKNDPEMVRKAFERSDILLPSAKVFPIEVHWHAKSGSVERILRAWNIGADSVVFVDDSPMELAEVAAAHPGIECVLFPKNDYPSAASFLRRLRDLFGKPRVTEEDALRLDSIRQGAAFQQVVEEGGSAPEAFLEKMNARITFDFRGALGDARVLELVNKTNQFNLNGVRYTEADWMNGADRDFVASVAYEDKFGPLGKIAVIRGRCEDGALRVLTWVMSCRAFARRIEHRCLRVLLDKYPEAAVIRFDFKPTAKNGPLRDFFADMAIRDNMLPRAGFEEKCPPLYHQVNANDE